MNKKNSLRVRKLIKKIEKDREVLFYLGQDSRIEYENINQQELKDIVGNIDKVMFDNRYDIEFYNFIDKKYKDGMTDFIVDLDIIKIENFNSNITANKNFYKRHISDPGISISENKMCEYIVNTKWIRNENGLVKINIDTKR